MSRGGVRPGLDTPPRPYLMPGPRLWCPPEVRSFDIRTGETAQMIQIGTDTMRSRMPPRQDLSLTDAPANAFGSGSPRGLRPNSLFALDGDPSALALTSPTIVLKARNLPSGAQSGRPAGRGTVVVGCGHEPTADRSVGVWGIPAQGVLGNQRRDADRSSPPAPCRRPIGRNVRRHRTLSPQRWLRLGFEGP